MSENNLFAQELELQAKNLSLQAKKLQAMADALKINDCVETNQANTILVQAVAEKVKRKLSKIEGFSLGVLANKLRGTDQAIIGAALIQMVNNGEVKAITTTPKKGPTVTRYYLNK